MNTGSVDLKRTDPGNRGQRSSRFSGWLRGVNQSDIQRWKLLSPILRIVEALKYRETVPKDQWGLRTALAMLLEVDQELVNGVKRLYDEHLNFILEVASYSEGEQIVRGYGQYAYSRLIGRVPVPDFIKIYRFIRSHLNIVPGIVNLPDFLLARINDVGDLGEAFLYSRIKGGAVPFPKPSAFFPAIDPMLDEKIFEAKFHQHQEFLETCSTLAQGYEQRQYLERYVLDHDSNALKHWVDTPKWKRPLITGDEEAREIWNTLQLLQANLCPDRSRVTRGGFYLQISKFCFANRPRWREVFWTLGMTLHDNNDPGDTTTPPWDSSKLK